jgi:mannose-6-phosphate isomerase-like protein (cupin superfamily)
MTGFTRSATLVALILTAVLPTMGSTDTTATVWKHDQLRGMEGKLSQELDEEHSASEVLGTYGNHHVEIALRRATGNAELHETQNDVFFIVSGEAMLITGGTLVDPKMTEPHEFEGKTIQGGTKTKLSAGDVVHIPFKVPHQLIVETGKEVEYFVVKIDAQTEPLAALDKKASNGSRP